MTQAMLSLPALAVVPWMPSVLPNLMIHLSVTLSLSSCASWGHWGQKDGPHLHPPLVYMYQQLGQDVPQQGQHWEKSADPQVWSRLGERKIVQRRLPSSSSAIRGPTCTNLKNWMGLRHFLKILLPPSVFLDSSGLKRGKNAPPVRSIGKPWSSPSLMVQPSPVPLVCRFRSLEEFCLWIGLTDLISSLMACSICALDA